MSKSFAVLPCNGLDKCAGCITHEIALQLGEKTGSDILCPVFYRVADAKYNQLAEEKPLVVLDGCSTRCASKLASEKGLKIAVKMNISEEAKSAGIDLPKSLRLDQPLHDFAGQIVNRLLLEEQAATDDAAGVNLPDELHYESYQKDKFIFRVPKDEGFYFNENDVWVYVSGNTARIGVTDFVQKSLSDIIYFDPPAVGSEIEQFEEAGSVESGKAVFEIVSPVSGTITMVNEKVVDAPELINDNPYEKGWIAEMTLSDFEADQDLLHDFEGYFPVLKRKVDEFHV